MFYFILVYVFVLFFRNIGMIKYYFIKFNFMEIIMEYLISDDNRYFRKVFIEVFCFVGYIVFIFDEELEKSSDRFDL